MALINDFMSLIFPRHCEACANTLFKHEYYICNYCKVNLPHSNFHLNPDSALHRTFAGRIPIINAGSYYIFEKSGKVQNLLHAIKYQNQKELAAHLGKLYALELTKHESFQAVDLIIPIPLHPKKLKARGFNQSEWFANGLGSGLNTLTNSQVMQRVVETSTQTRKKKYQRWENVENIFQLTNKSELENKHVLLVDDVITTGATLEAAWQALKEVDGISISIASIAFASMG